MRSIASAAPEADHPGDRGSAPAEFAMLSGLLALVFLAVIQLGLALHARNTVIDSAVAGAHHAALADRSLADGERRTHELITAALGEDFAEDIEARTITVDGATMIEVRVQAPTPVLGLIGPSGTRTLSGRALVLEP